MDKTEKKDLFTGFGDWIEIFRGGPQTDSSGRVHDGNRLIERAVAGFNVAEHEPPLVVGHPADNAPAFGWVKDLRRKVNDGVEVMEARFKQVAPELEDLVRRGLYKKRSAAFYADGRLRHVGLLGAAPPAVKGLADLSFSLSAAATFEFAEDENQGSLNTALAPKDQGEKVMIFTEQDLKAAEDKARSETEQRLKAEIAEKEAVWTREKRKAELSALVDKKVQEGRVPPALAGAGLVEFLCAIDQVPEMNIAEGDQIHQVKPVDHFLAWLDKAGELSLFKEIASKDRVFKQLLNMKQDDELGDAIAARVKS